MVITALVPIPYSPLSSPDTVSSAKQRRQPHPFPLLVYHREDPRVIVVPGSSVTFYARNRRHASMAPRLEKISFLANLRKICLSGFVPDASTEGERRIAVENQY